MKNDINLLPDIILYKNKRILKFIQKASLCLLVIVSVVIFVLYRSNQLSELEKKVSTLTQQISPDAFKDINDFEEKLAKKTTEKTNLDSVLQGILVEKLKTSDLISKITFMMPDSASATSINFDQKTNKIVFVMEFTNRQDISVFLKRVHDDASLTNINITAITEKSGIYNFSLIISF